MDIMEEIETVCAYRVGCMIGVNKLKALEYIQLPNQFRSYAYKIIYIFMYGSCT